jgi:hypothetical protein
VFVLRRDDAAAMVWPMLPCIGRSGCGRSTASPYAGYERVKESSLERDLVWQCRVGGVPEPVRELVFAPPRRWRFDLAWPEHKLALEIQGGVWVQGRHARGAGITADAEKLSRAAVLGWRVLVVTGEHVKGGQAWTWIREALGMEGA